MKRKLIVSAIVTWTLAIAIVSIIPRQAEAQQPTPTPQPVKDVAVAVKENPVPAGSFAEVVIEGLGPKTGKIVDVTPTPAKLVEVGNTLYFSGLEPKYTVEVITASVEGDGRVILARKKVVVTFAQNPKPPTPDPVDPPTPDTPAPIPVAGLRVLIVYEFMDTMGITAEQHNAIYGKSFRDWTNANCVKGTDGTPERRVWDKDVDTTNAAKHWQDAMKRPRKSIPWIIVSNGKTGFEGPLPATEAEIMTLVNKYK